MIRKVVASVPLLVAAPSNPTVATEFSIAKPEKPTIEYSPFINRSYPQTQNHLSKSDLLHRGKTKVTALNGSPPFVRSGNKSDFRYHPLTLALADVKTARPKLPAISLKLRNATAKVSSLGRQLEDDTRILHAYTNEYALGRRMQSGGEQRADHKVERAK
ncbi:unnamed protein product [marine sediment metagenome]|uniref:Uncharacterized protein n=1 Tax=marine sediment metagenome TaxID=412755 RepID=X0UY85_9ZZZZ